MSKDPPTCFDYHHAWVLFRACNHVRMLVESLRDPAGSSEHYPDREKTQVTDEFIAGVEARIRSGEGLADGEEPSPLAPWLPAALDRFDHLVRQVYGETVAALLRIMDSEIKELVPVFRQAIAAAAPRLVQNGHRPDQLDQRLAGIPRVGANEAWERVAKVHNVLQAVGAIPCEQAGKRKRTAARKRPKKRSRPELSEQEQKAWAAYERLKTYTAVGTSLGISRQAATKLVKSAQAKVQAMQGRSARTGRRIPEDHREQANVVKDDGGLSRPYRSARAGKPVIDD